MSKDWRTLVSKLSFLRWLWFGAVVYVTLFILLKRNLRTNSGMEQIHRACESQEMIHQICSCHKKPSLAIPKTQSSPPTHDQSDTAQSDHESWKQKSIKALQNFPRIMGNRNIRRERRKVSSSHRNEKRHIAFVKTHKAASSTVLNILYRFALSRDLVLLLPKSGNYIHGRYLNKTFLLPPPNGMTYDILCNHAIFNYTSFAKFLPSDTVYIGIVREPFQRLLSALYYFRYDHPKEYLKKIPGNYYHSVKIYLEDPSRFEPKDAMASMTNNRMALDFGYPPEHFHNHSIFDQYLLNLRNTFKLVMVAERFDESVVLMKRALNWTIKDILYTVKNKSRLKPMQVPSLEKLKNNYLQKFSHLDDKLYSFFLMRLEKQIEQSGSNFSEEVAYFKRVRGDVERFCTYNRYHRQIDIPRSNWTDAFSVDKRDCRYLRMEELIFLYYVHGQQTRALQGWGVNTEFLKSLP